MFFLLMGMLLGSIHSLIYEKTSTTPIQISCTLSGTGNTINSTSYADHNTLESSWVWIANNAIDDDTCTVNFTFEYLAGSQVNMSLQADDTYHIYLNNVLLASGYVSTVKTAIDSYFNGTGIYYIGIVIYHNHASFGFSFIIVENYNCPPNCNQCSSPTTCLSCSQNAYLQTTSCTCSGGTCTTQKNPFLTLNLSVFADQVADSSSGIIFETGINTDFFLNGTSSDPIPAYQRGYYFTSTSYMTSTNFILPFDYSMIFYIKQMTPGTLLSKNSLAISTNSGVSYIINSIISASFENFISTGWVIMKFSVWNDINWKINCMLSYPPSSGSTATASLAQLYYDTSSSLVLGSPSNSFVGFIYSFTIYAGVETISVSSITTCTSLSSNCLWNCDFNSYFNGTSCVQCLNTCTEDCPSSCANGCCRGTDCGLNNDTKCGNYSSYTSCTNCLPNASFVSGVCQCNFGYYWSGIQCDLCNASCLTCSGKLFNQCLTCPINSLLNSQNQCVCNTTYYWNGTLCVSCNETCLTCSGSLPNQCLSCPLNSNLNSQNQCVCNTSYYWNNTDCNKCDPTCLTCSGSSSNQCLSCPLNSTLIASNECLSCSDPHAIVENNVCVCNQGFYNDSLTNTCLNCNSSCSACNNSVTCLQCSDSNTILINSECFCKPSYLPVKNTCKKCWKIYEFTNNSCYCPNLCTDCLVSQCTSCVENAHLQGSSCVCDISYFGATSCLYSNFTLLVTLNSENSLLLSFIEEPLIPLNFNDIKISITSIKDYSFTLIKYSNLSYLVNVTYNEDIPENCTLTLEFVSPIYSIYNGNLTTLQYTFTLASKVWNTNAAISYQSEQTASTATQSCTIGSFSVSLLNLNFVTLWNFLNIIQLLCYIRLSDVSLPPKFNGQLKGLQKFNMIPNVFTYFLNENDHKMPNKKYVTFGYSSSILFFNAGSWMTTGICLLTVFLICFTFSKINKKPFSYKFVKEKLESFVQSYKFGKLIRYLIQTYLDYFASSIIGLLLFNTSTTVDRINIAFCIAILVILLLTPFFCLKITIINTKKDNKKEGLLDVYSTLFSEFSKDNSLSSSLYYCLFFIRRILFLLSVLLVPNQPIVQLTLSFILSFSVIFT